jgi:hypothetical protein
MSDTRDIEMETCRFCGAEHGGRCPFVKAIEYHRDGKIKRVEFIGSEPSPLPYVPWDWSRPFPTPDPWFRITD